MRSRIKPNGNISAINECSVICEPIGCAVDFVCRLLHLKIISLKKPLQIGLCNKAIQNSKLTYSEYTETGAQLTSIQPDEHGEYIAKKFETNEIILSFFNPDISAIVANLQDLYANLRPFSSFENQNDWINHYLNHLCQIFKIQAHKDNLMSPCFDVYFQNKETYIYGHIANTHTALAI
ncbi:hypothetical protein [Acinetobacter indicus]|uniref:hypothetical protein n=1 Tax=Acinetobacter indicus TaxID=756892 RepID=UPI0013E29807|nr:hypothetical protein [Acinetobacter indicus]UNW03453.1 hypothetical protein MOW12_10010 [Acinetobacter indicus]